MMLVNLSDADVYADAVLKAVSLDGHDGPDLRLVACRWGVRIFLAPAGARWRHVAEWVRLGDEDRVYVRSTLSEAERAHPVGHELGHVAIRRWGLRVEGDPERWCNRFGSALMCPGDAVRRAWRHSQGSLAGVIDRWPTAPATAVALRLPEAIGLPTCIMDGRRVRYVSGVPVDMLPTLRDLAVRAINGGAAALDDGTAQAVRLADAPRRAAVVLLDAA